MSGAGNRLNVVPTVSVLAVMKSRLSGAVKGHSLLKKKADALTMRFRQILKTIVQTKEEMGKKFRQSAFALTEAKYAAGDFRHTVLDNVEQASVKVQCLLHSQDVVNHNASVHGQAGVDRGLCMWTNSVSKPVHYGAVNHT